MVWFTKVTAQGLSLDLSTIMHPPASRGSINPSSRDKATDSRLWVNWPSEPRHTDALVEYLLEHDGDCSILFPFEEKKPACVVPPTSEYREEINENIASFIFKDDPVYAGSYVEKSHYFKQSVNYRLTGLQTRYNYLCHTFHETGVIAFDADEGENLGPWFNDLSSIWRSYPGIGTATFSSQSGINHATPPSKFDGAGAPTALVSGAGPPAYLAAQPAQVPPPSAFCGAGSPPRMHDDTTQWQLVPSPSPSPSRSPSPPLLTPSDLPPQKSQMPAPSAPSLTLKKESKDNLDRSVGKPFDDTLNYEAERLESKRVAWENQRLPRKLDALRQDKDKEQNAQEFAVAEHERMEASKDKDHQRALEIKDKDHRRALEIQDKDHRRALEIQDKVHQRALEIKDKEIQLREIEHKVEALRLELELVKSKKTGNI